MLASTIPVYVDIPVDPGGAAPGLAYGVSRPRAQPGDPLVYTLTVNNPRTQERRGIMLRIDLPRGLRLRADTLRIDGIPPPPGSLSVSANGQQLDIALDRLPGSGAVVVAFGAVIRADASSGPLVSRATIRDRQGRSSRAEAAVLVERDTITGRMTIIGRVVLGECGVADSASGLSGVRVMLEDGSFAVTDAEGRYRFEGRGARHTRGAGRARQPAAGCKAGGLRALHPQRRRCRFALRHRSRRIAGPGGFPRGQSRHSRGRPPDRPGRGYVAGRRGDGSRHRQNR